MSKTISQLPQLTSAASTDKMLIEDVVAGATKYILLSDLQTALAPLTPNNAITAAMLGSGAIYLGRATATANITTTNTSDSLAAGLTVGVTPPAGGRRIKISFQCQYAAVTGTSGEIGIYKGATSGALTTKLSGILVGSGTAAPTSFFGIDDSPGAGTVYYSIGIHTNNVSDTFTVAGGTAVPIIILVEAE